MSVKNQILRGKIDFFNEYLFKFGTIENNYVLINPNHFKRAKYSEILKEFLDKIEPFYHLSKKKYIRYDMNYMQFITILRQISHMNGVFFEYKIKYTNSKHYMEYYFFFNTPQNIECELKEIESFNT
jgi:hypothetical protein